jgi:16S rRNA (uracil1498-N3)-methyltransferase
MASRVFFAGMLASGEMLTLPPAESRHLQVRRLQPGDAVLLFNGEDGLEWSAEITRIGRAEVELRIAGAVPVGRELPIAVTLALGVPANERMDAFVEKATELGVAAIQPLICERSVVRLAGDRAEARRRHWRAVAASASEQCGRVRVPAVAMPMRLDDWLRSLDGVAGQESRMGRVVLSLDARAAPAAAVFESVAHEARPSLAVLSGPEGGLAPAEEEAAVAAGFVRVELGSRVLRADTAPLALLAWLGLASSAAPP